MENIHTKHIDVIYNENFIELAINDGITALKQTTIIKIFDKEISVKNYLVGETYFRSNGDLDAKLKTEEFTFLKTEILNLEFSKDLLNNLSISIVTEKQTIKMVSIPFDKEISWFIFNLLNFKK